MSGPVRLFCATSPNNQDWEAEAVYEYTARKHCSLPLEITWMRLSRDKSSPWRGWNTASWVTPFTGLRWSIPDVCGWQGRGIYTDVDFAFFGDLAELWTQDMGGKVFLLKRPDGKLKTCCMLIDCAAAKGHFLTIEKMRPLPDANGTMLQYFRDRTHLLGAYQGDWNCIDGGKYDFVTEFPKALHYSRIEHQLHLKHAIPRLKRDGGTHWYPGEVFPHIRPDLQGLFDELLDEATAAGYAPERYRVEPYGHVSKKQFTYSVHPTKGAQ